MYIYMYIGTVTAIFYTVVIVILYMETQLLFCMLVLIVQRCQTL